MATLAIMGISVLLATVTSFIGVRSLDLENYKRLMIESSKARKAGINMRGEEKIGCPRRSEIAEGEK